MDSSAQPPAPLRLRSQERERKRKRARAFERSRNAEYARGWRVFAEQRNFAAERARAALQAKEARRLRRDKLPPPEESEAISSTEYDDYWGMADSMEVLPGGKRIVTTLDNGNLMVSDVADSALLWDVDPERHGGHSPTRMAVLDDNVVAIGGNRDVRTWNVDSGVQLGKIKVGARGVSALAAISCRRFVVGCWGGDIVFFDHEQGARLAQSFRLVNESPHSDYCSVDCFAVCRDRMASVRRNGEVAIWNLQTRSRMAVIRGYGRWGVAGVDMSDSVLVIASLDEPYLRVHSVANNLACFGATGAFDWVHNDLVISVRILDSAHVMSTSSDGTIAVTAFESNEVIARVNPGFWPRFSAVLFDGSIAVTGHIDEEYGGCETRVFPAPRAAACLLKAYGESRNRARLS